MSTSLPLALNVAISIPLPPSEAQYTAEGRQARYVETALQRYARVEFLRHQQRLHIQTSATSERRVGEWVTSQLGQKSWQWGIESSTASSSRRGQISPNKPILTSPPISFTTPKYALPKLQPSPARHASPVKPGPSPLSREPLYAVPETDSLDIEEESLPHGYREPYIFYSSSESLHPSQSKEQTTTNTINIVSPPRRQNTYPPRQIVIPESTSASSPTLQRSPAIKRKQNQHKRQAASYGGSSTDSPRVGVSHRRTKSLGSHLLSDISEEVEEESR